MIGRWLGSLVAAPLRADEPAAGRCGFGVDVARVQRLEAGVPLLMSVVHVSQRSERQMASRRLRLIERGRACAARYPQTAGYLRSILARLVHASALDAFASGAPDLQLVLECSDSVPLPIARATTGKIMAVPRALVALAGSEDAIAAVLAHELAHLTLRHLEQVVAASSESTPLVGYAMRTLMTAHEREADIVGLKLLVDAGYDPNAAIDHLHDVDMLASQMELPPPSGPGEVHDGVEERSALLRTQMRACGYRSVDARTPVAAQVEAELHAASR
jgi:beta-barrel assembly-enhancing protease